VRRQKEADAQDELLNSLIYDLGLRSKPSSDSKDKEAKDSSDDQSNDTNSVLSTKKGYSL